MPVCTGPDGHNRIDLRVVLRNLSPDPDFMTVSDRIEVINDFEPYLFFLYVIDCSEVLKMIETEKRVIMKESEDGNNATPFYDN